MKQLSFWILALSLTMLGLSAFTAAQADRQVQALRRLAGELPEVIRVAREACACGERCECCKCQREPGQ